MKKLWPVWIVLLCVLLLSCACGKQNTPDQPDGEPDQSSEPKSPEEIVAAVFGDKPYSLSYTASVDGACSVSNIVFNPNCTEDYTLVIPAQASYGQTTTVTELRRGKYRAFRTVEAVNVPCVMTESAYHTLIAAMQTENASNDQLIAALFVQNCFEQQNLAFAKDEKVEKTLRYYFPLVDYTVIYNLKADITPEDLARLSDYLTTYAAYTEADKQQAYEEVILLTGDHLEEEQYFASLWYLSNHSAKYMTALELPACLEQIESGALSGCTRLENIRFAGTMAQWAAVEKGEDWHEGVPATVVHCTDGDAMIDAREPSSGLAFQSNGDGTCYVSGIGTCTDTDIVIPTLSSDDESGEVVVSIGTTAFEFCTAITSIVIPDSVTTIKRGAFHGCENLERVELGTQITGIGQYAFKDCTSLTGIVFPDTLAEIGSKAFKNCTSLKKIVFPDGVTQIDEESFMNCISLSEITFSNALTDINKDAFMNCVSLSEIIFPESLIDVGESAFMGCTGLTDIVFLTNAEPQEPGSIRDNAFYGCENLSSIGFSEWLCYIGEQAFYGCKKLTKIVIPDSVEVILHKAFYRCPLEEVTIGRNVQSIRETAFRGCLNNAKILYNGTMAQCYAISEDWDGLESRAVQCTDGFAWVEIPIDCPCHDGDVPIGE